MVMPSIFLSTQKIGEPKSILSFDVILSVEFPERETKICTLALTDLKPIFFPCKLELTEFQKYIKNQVCKFIQFSIDAQIKGCFLKFFLVDSTED